MPEDLRDIAKTHETPANQPGSSSVTRDLYASEETLVQLRLIRDEIARWADMVIDHEQRFDTLQTPWWKRVWFWVQGWPWYDLNAPARKRRPWRR